jgi:hypothetical protein
MLSCSIHDYTKITFEIAKNKSEITDFKLDSVSIKGYISDIPITFITSNNSTKSIYKLCFNPDINYDSNFHAKINFVISYNRGLDSSITFLADTINIDAHTDFKYNMLISRTRPINAIKNICLASITNNYLDSCFAYITSFYTSDLIAGWP